MLFLSLLGCSNLFGGHDGSYLLIARKQSDTCNPDASDIGQEQQLLVSVYHTKDDLVVDVGGQLLTGSTSGKDFEVSWEQGYVTSSSGCDGYTQNNKAVLSGTFGADLGFEGNLTSTDSTVLEDCPDSSEEICVTKFAVTAMKLDAERDRHPTGTISWGYFSY